MDRRSFVKGALVSAGAVAAGAGPAGATTANIALPSLGSVLRPSRTPVEHIVVLMMENRSVDHYLGWYGAEHSDFGATQTASFPDLREPGQPLVPTEPWGARGRNNFHGRGFTDPSHGWAGGRAERRGGSCDGWLDPSTGNDEYTLSTYDAIDLPVWSQLVRGYQAYDRWFCSLLGPTQPNRYYMHSAQSGGLKNNDLPPQLAGERPEWTLGWDWPTVWTLCERAGVSAGYYFCNLPEIAVWGPRHLSHARPIASFYLEALAGTLPQVSFVDPWFIGPGGLANDDHPHADLRLGQAFISDVVEAFTSSPCYQKGALVVTYDEWGGFWDHVAPPRVADDRATPLDPGGDDDFGQLGFRIPSTIVSPWTRARPDGHGNQNVVDHTVYDHASVLRFISDNWGLPYLNMRHAHARSIGGAFADFQHHDPEPAFEPYEAPLGLLLEPTLEDPLAQLDALPVPVSLPLPSTDAVSDLHLLAELGWFESLPVDLDQRFEDSFLRSRPELIADALRLVGL